MSTQRCVRIQIRGNFWYNISLGHPVVTRINTELIFDILFTLLGIV